MPIPVIIGIGAAVAGAIGVGTGIAGGIMMKEANDTMKSADRRHKQNIRLFEETQEEATKQMDSLGKLELDILKSFEDFQEIIEKIQNRPEFKPYNKNGITIPEYKKEEIDKASVGAALLLGGLGGGAVGAAGGFAAAGATTAAVMALGTASTGTAISTLSGAAATNAALAALGGGSLATGGGGIALGSAILGGATLGVGLLVGGVIFSITGSSLSDKADEAWAQMKKAEAEILPICDYLEDLTKTAKQYEGAIDKVNKIYQSRMDKLKSICQKQADMFGTIDWRNFSTDAKKCTENTELLVRILYKMCKVNVVEKSGEDDEINTINKKGVEESIQESEKLLHDNQLAA